MTGPDSLERDDRPLCGCGHAEFYPNGDAIHVCECDGGHSDETSGDDYCQECRDLLRFTEAPDAWHVFAPVETPHPEPQPDRNEPGRTDNPYAAWDGRFGATLGEASFEYEGADPSAKPRHAFVAGVRWWNSVLAADRAGHPEPPAVVDEAKATQYVTSRWGTRPRDERARLIDAFNAGRKSARKDSIAADSPSLPPLPDDERLAAIRARAPWYLSMSARDDTKYLLELVDRLREGR